MDPLKPYLPELMNMHKLIYPAGDGRINYITRNDIARGVIAIIKIQILGAERYLLSGYSYDMEGTCCNFI